MVELHPAVSSGHGMRDPFPQFPELKNVWGDADNWTTGHWLNGRLGTARLGDLIADLLSTSGIE